MREEYIKLVVFELLAVDERRSEIFLEKASSHLRNSKASSCQIHSGISFNLVLTKYKFVTLSSFTPLISISSYVTSSSFNLLGFIAFGKEEGIAL